MQQLEIAVRIGYSDKCVQVVQSELNQAVSQTEVAFTPELSKPQQSVNEEQFRQVTHARVVS